MVSSDPPGPDAATLTPLEADHSIEPDSNDDMGDPIDNSAKNDEVLIGLTERSAIDDGVESGRQRAGQ